MVCPAHAHHRNAPKKFTSQAGTNEQPPLDWPRTKPGVPLINTGFLLAAKPYKELFVEDRVPEHGLCRSLGLEVGAKDFLLDNPERTT